MKARLLTGTAIVGAVGLVASLSSMLPASSAPPGKHSTIVDCSAVLRSPDRATAFAAAATATGVPVRLLEAVSYMETRWDDHAGKPSTDGGYGPMHLTDLAGANGAAATAHADGKGVDNAATAGTTVGETLDLAADRTGLSAARLKTDVAANICGGAAVLAAFQADAGAATGIASDVSGWQRAVGRYGSAGADDGTSFARQVYSTMQKGVSRTTSDGDTLALRADPDVTVPTVATASDPRTDCPKRLACEWIEAPYSLIGGETDPNSGNYGNHDLADRTGSGGPKLRYIVIHDTEGTYDGSVALAQDPTYLAWNYTIRSSDGHIAQHLNPKDVGWHAGNWYVNMHSIGVEHEGKAGTGAWFTEAMYENSATLVKYLAKKYAIPLDRAHIIGHDQVPGILPGATASVHWDPGPYWDWEHYFGLLGAPIGGAGVNVAKVKTGDVVTVRPGYQNNPHTLTNCEEQSPGSGACKPNAPTNYVALYQQPDSSAPLAKDPGTHPDGSNSTVSIQDSGARAAAGQKLVVARTEGEWVGVWWAGSLVWFDNPASAPVVTLGSGKLVTAKAGLTAAPVYGRAYPEAGAYPSTIPAQAVTPIEYTIPAGQAYVLTDKKVSTDYYYAKTFNGAGVPGDRTDVVGTDRYYQVNVAHRVAYVRAADVDVTPTTPRLAVTTNAKSQCVNGKAAIAVYAANGSSVATDIRLQTDLGTKVYSKVAPGKAVYALFAGHKKKVAAGNAWVRTYGVVDSQPVSNVTRPGYDGLRCH
jgi:hypothetical protein